MALLDKSGNHIALVCSNIKIISNNNQTHKKIVSKADILRQVSGFDENAPREIDSDMFRTCIVKYNYDVLFMEDVTTLVREFGSDWMTLQDSVADKLDSIDSINLFFLKFSSYLGGRFEVKHTRYRQLISLYYRLLKDRIKLSYPFKGFRIFVLFVYYKFISTLNTYVK